MEESASASAVEIMKVDYFLLFSITVGVFVCLCFELSPILTPLLLFQSENDPFGTRKNAVEVINSWRSVLSFEDVKYLQVECRSVLERFNYKLVRSEEEQKNLKKELVF